jgi:DNA-binding SARP family transcriptional activator
VDRNHGNGGPMPSDNGRMRVRPGGSATAQGRLNSTADDGLLADEVFRLFPYGILVLDASGAVVAANLEAEELLGEAYDRTACCCNLFGCGRRGTALAGLCLTQLARSRRRRLPEVRLTLPGDGGKAVWLTAAPLGEDASRIVVQLRAADPKDRRRRTKPHWTRGPRLRVVALGRTRVESREGPIGGAWLEQRPGQLFKYLVCNRHRVVAAEELATSIWPDAGRSALGSVRHYVHELRDRLEPDRRKRAPSSFVIARQGGYTLDRNKVLIDIDEFEEPARAGLAAFRRGDVEEAGPKLERAISLYGGDLFAEDPYAVWALQERDRLRELAASGLRVLAELAERAGDHDGAHDHLKHLAELEPYDMESQRQLIRSSLRLGRRSEAARRYTALRAKLLHEFGEEPDFELADLAEDSRSQLRLI